jgi:hypothetical protein
MNQIKYDFIFLIISSDDLECYSKMRYYARNYFKLYNTQIKYFFIELKEDLNCDLCEDNDYIYVKGTESIAPGIYIKTIKSMKYINENYNYDFIVRTNLSSFWNLNNLLLLKNNLSHVNFCGGYIIFNRFISGTGIILSKDVCINLSKELNIGNENDDVHISALLCQFNYTLNNISQYKMEYLINNIGCIDNYTIDIPSTLYFRVKNIDRNNDIELFKSLYDKIYNISTSEIENI